MASEFMMPSARTSTEQQSEDVDRKLDEIVQSVRILVQETDALKRLKDQLIIHARQVDFDMQRLRDLHKNLRVRLEARPAEPSVETQDPEPARAISTLSLTDTNWQVQSDSGAYNKQNVRLRYALNMDAVLCTIKYNSDGRLFTFADGKNVFIMNSADGSLIGACQIPRTGNATAHTLAIVFSPDTKLIALNGQNDHVILIDVQTKRHLSTLTGHKDMVRCLGFLSDSQTLISGGLDGMLCVWNVNEVKPRLKIPHGNGEEKILSLSVAPDDQFILVGFMNGTVGIYDKTFQGPPTMFTAHTDLLFSVSVAPSGLICATSHDKVAKVWRLGGAASCKTLTGHTDLVLTVAFAPTKPIVFTGSKDESIKCWNYETGQNLFTLTGHKNTVLQVDHHPLSKTFVSCSGEGLVCVWDYTF